VDVHGEKIETELKTIAAENQTFKRRLPPASNKNLGAHARDGLAQFDEGERFVEEEINVRRRLFAGAAPIDRGGGENDGVAGTLLLDVRGQLLARHARHEKIGDEEVEGFRSEKCQPSFAAVSHDDGMPLMLQQHLDGAADGRLVVHDQDSQVISPRISHRICPRGK
jgi:hypothetical protein